MVYRCSVCQESISGGVYEYSVNHFGKPLCIEHQREVSPKNGQKRRYFSIEEAVAVKQKWAKINAVDLGELRSIHDFADYLTGKINGLVVQQPKCWLLKETYDQEFEIYKSQVQTALCSNRKSLKLVGEDFPRAKRRLQSVEEDIRFLLEWRLKEHERMDDYQKGEVAEIIGRLKSLESNFELVAKEKVGGVDDLKVRFEGNVSVLEPLLKSTHVWVPVETQRMVLKSG